MIKQDEKLWQKIIFHLLKRDQLIAIKNKRHCSVQPKRNRREQMNSSKYNKNLLSAVIHKLSEECMFTRHLSFGACRDPSLWDVNSLLGSLKPMLSTVLPMSVKLMSGVLLEHLNCLLLLFIDLFAFSSHPSSKCPPSVTRSLTKIWKTCG